MTKENLDEAMAELDRIAQAQANNQQPLRLLAFGKFKNGTKKMRQEPKQVPATVASGTKKAGHIDRQHFRSACMQILQLDLYHNPLSKYPDRIWAPELATTCDERDLDQTIPSCSQAMHRGPRSESGTSACDTVSRQHQRGDRRPQNLQTRRVRHRQSRIRASISSASGYGITYGFEEIGSE